MPIHAWNRRWSVPLWRQKAKLGWIPASRVVTTASSGRWFVADVAEEGASGLRVPIPGDQTGEGWYWVTARRIGEPLCGGEISRTYPQADPLNYVAVWTVLSTIALADTLAYDATPETLTDTAGVDTLLHLHECILAGAGATAQAPCISPWWQPEPFWVRSSVSRTAIGKIMPDVCLNPRVTGWRWRWRWVCFQQTGHPSSMQCAQWQTHLTHCTSLLSVNATDPDGDELSIFWSHRNAAR